MATTKFVIFKNSMLFDDAGKQTDCYLTNLDIHSWNNDIKEAIVFDNIEKAEIVLEKYHKSSTQKAYIKEIV